MAIIIYRDREGAPITPAKWSELQNHPDYKFIHRYDNGKLRVIGTWVGKASLKQGQPASSATLYQLEVINIVTTDLEGNALPEPKEIKDIAASGAFRTEAELTNSYEDLLVRYAGCEWVPSGRTSSGVQLVEHGNRYAPLDRAVPVIEDGLDTSSFGSW